MPSRKKSPKSNDVVEVVEADNPFVDWESIERIAPAYNDPEPGDITKPMMAAHYKISLQSVDEKMRRIAESGEYYMVVVKFATGGRPHTVLRKVVK